MKNQNSSKSSEEEGNNIVSSSNIVKEKIKQISPACCWCFTFNNYTEEIVLKFQEIMKINCKLGFFNKEVGESGTPHLQGYIELKNKGRPLNIFPVGCHWKKAKGNLDQNFKYCSKDAVDGNMTFNFGYKLKPKIKIISELRPFQKQILDMLEKPVDEGKIIWIFDKEGQLGKTQMLRYLHVKKGCPFTYGGKKGDIINLVFNNKEYLLGEDKAIMIYNFSRATDPRAISYESMEQISDGAISNNKFEAGCFVCNPPHVLVFSNCMPVLEMMTKSRWKFFGIDKDLNLIKINGKNLDEENELI